MALSAGLAACSPTNAEPTEWRVIPGERVGPIDAKTTRSGLVEIFGAENVADIDHPIGEGETMPATAVFPGTAQEAVVLWKPDHEGTAIDRVFVTGSAWKLPHGLRPGDGLEATERLCGGPFQIYGFGWDYGGTAIFEGTALDGKVGVLFQPSEGSPSDGVIGDSLFDSTLPAMRAADPRVEEVAIILDIPASD